MLLLHGTLLVLWPSVLTTFDLNEVDALMAGGAAEVLPVSLVALCHSKEPTPSIISSFLVFATSTVSGLLEVYLF